MKFRIGSYLNAVGTLPLPESHGINSLDNPTETGINNIEPRRGIHIFAGHPAGDNVTDGRNIPSAGRAQQTQQ